MSAATFMSAFFSIGFGSSNLARAAKRSATAVTAMCVAVRHVTYGKPSVLIRYLFTITMLTEDVTESANAPTVPISIRAVSEGTRARAFFFPTASPVPGKTKTAPRDPLRSWSFASSAWIVQASGTSADGMCLPNPGLLDMYRATRG